MKNVKKILVVASHPDDEVLGCGGTIARLAKEGCRICTLILGEGVTSRDKKRDVGKRSVEIKNLKKQAESANKTIGVTRTVMCDLPDNRFDTIPMLDIVKSVEKVIEEFDPDVIYTHHPDDLNVDHKITFKAVLTASRPLPGSRIKEIYSFEVPSSTEWNFPGGFTPNTFVDISGTMKLKQKALRCYGSELREFPHPRSCKAIEAIAERWGSVSGLKSAEAFQAVRIIK